MIDDISEYVESLTDLEISLEDTIEHCLKVGVTLEDIKAAVIGMIRKYEAKTYGVIIENVQQTK